MAKPNTRASAKKKAGKKAGGKKKAAAKKPASKKAGKKAAAKKAAAKKPAAKKPGKKAAAKKPAAKKPAAKKPAAKKAGKKATKQNVERDSIGETKLGKRTEVKDSHDAYASPDGSEKPAGKSSAGGKRVGAEPAGESKPAPSAVDLEVGSPAPDFELESDEGEPRSLESLAGQRFVLYFYPRDNTPGCTTEAKEFSDLAGEFEALGVPVFGLSTDTLKSHVKFREKHGLKVGLLSDPDARAARAYGAWGSKQMYGKPVVGMIRTTFIIGPDGRIERKYVVRQAAGHAAQVLEDVRAMAESPSGDSQERDDSSEGEFDDDDEADDDDLP